MGSSQEEEHVNFLTPQNDEFYSQKPYAALDVKRREIRLLRLLPGSRADPLECEIISGISLTDLKLDYEAISYRAGDVDANENIKVQGLEFNAFASLAAALRMFRDGESARLLWTDQICIDQANVAERESQVQIMRDIYESAYRTLVWLGEVEDDPNGLALTFVRALYDKGKELRLKYAESADDASSLTPDAGLADEVIKTDAVDDKDEQIQFTLPPDPPFYLSGAATWLARKLNQGQYEAEVGSLARMFNAPYWNRCWIF